MFQINIFPFSQICVQTLFSGQLEKLEESCRISIDQFDTVQVKLFWFLSYIKLIEEHNCKRGLNGKWHSNEFFSLHVLQKMGSSQPSFGYISFRL